MLNKKDLPCSAEVYVSDKKGNRQTGGIMQGKYRMGINGFISKLHKLCYAPFCIIEEFTVWEMQFFIKHEILQHSFRLLLFFWLFHHC